MPLFKSASKEAVGKNIAAEESAGKPHRQAVAIALDIQRRAGGGKRKRMKKMKPKGKRGKAQVKKLGRSYKTGGFDKIASKAGKEYGSAEAGKRVAGKIFSRMVAAKKKR